MNDYKNLIHAIVEKGEDVNDTVDFLYERMEKFTLYFNTVYRAVIRSEISNELRAGGLLTQEDYQTRIMTDDRDRRIAHDSAIDACRQINRLCDRYNEKRICPETDDRYVIADYIGRFVYEVYQKGQSQTRNVDLSKSNVIDDIIENAKMRASMHPSNPDKIYDPKKVRECIR